MRVFDRNEQVWEIGVSRGPGWFVDGLEATGWRCWRHDSKAGRVTHVFRADQIETTSARNRRADEEDRLRREEDDRIKGRKQPLPPLYPA